VPFITDVNVRVCNYGSGKLIFRKLVSGNCVSLSMYFIAEGMRGGNTYVRNKGRKIFVTL